MIHCIMRKTSKCQYKQKKDETFVNITFSDKQIKIENNNIKMFFFKVISSSNILGMIENVQIF